MASAPSPSKRAVLLRNLQAGTTTAVVIIPQGMAYALVAGLPPIHGLYASVLPLIAYALLGRSRQLAVGPGALDTLLVGTSLAGLSFVTAETYASYAAVLALQVAIIQIVLGALRAGFLVNFLSRPVLSGFTSAAAITIALSQIHNLLGFGVDKSPHVHELVGQIVEHVGESNGYTAIIGLVSAVALMALKKLWRRFPRALFVVVIAVVVSQLAGLEGRGVAVIGAIPAGFPALALPTLDWPTFTALLPTALTIAFVGYLTMISIAKVFADRNRYDIDANRELIAAGGANFMASLAQGFPVSASFSRSAVHASAGSTSHFTLIITAGWVALTLMFLTDTLYHLPKATLAAIIITAVLGLIDIKAVRHLYKVKRVDLWTLLITFAATLGVGIEPGILIGIACSLLAFLYGTTRPHTAILGRVGDSADFRNIKNYQTANTLPGVVIIRIDAQFYFGNVTFLKNLLNRLEREAGAPLEAVILEACSFTQLDSSADDALHAIIDEYHQRGIKFYFASVKVPVLTVMKASGLYDKVGADGFFMNVDDAVRAHESSRAQGGATSPA